MAVTVQGPGCATQPHMYKPQGTAGDRRLQEAQAQGEAAACCSEDQGGNLAHSHR